MTEKGGKIDLIDSISIVSKLKINNFIKILCLSSLFTFFQKKNPAKIQIKFNKAHKTVLMLSTAIKYSNRTFNLVFAMTFVLCSVIKVTSTKRKEKTIKFSKEPAKF